MVKLIKRQRGGAFVTNRTLQFLCCTLILLVFLSLMSGCAAKSSIKKDSGAKTAQQVSSNAPALSPEMLKDIESGEIANLADDGACSKIWTPENQESTLSKITSWLQRSATYTGQVPTPQKKLVFNANIAPSIIFIKTLNKRTVSVQPAFYADADNKICYVKNVLQLNFDGKKSYIESEQLYNWLKNDEWKAEFKN